MLLQNELDDIADLAEKEGPKLAFQAWWSAWKTTPNHPNDNLVSKSAFWLTANGVRLLAFLLVACQSRVLRRSMGAPMWYLVLLVICVP